MTITAEDCVRALQQHRNSTTAAELAVILDTSSRAVATALRGPTGDGRIKMTFRKGRAWYRFIRLTPRPATQKAPA